MPSFSVSKKEKETLADCVCVCAWNVWTLRILFIYYFTSQYSNIVSKTPPDDVYISVRKNHQSVKVTQVHCGSTFKITVSGHKQFKKI